MGESKHIANATTWLAVSSAPDFCQVGNSVVPFDTYAVIDNCKLASPNVLAQAKSVYRVGDLHQGVLADAGIGIVSGTSQAIGFVRFVEGQHNVNVNGLPVIRHDSACLVNCNGAGIGGALGRVLTEVIREWAKSESPNDALRALLHKEFTPWYTRAFETIDSVLRFHRPEMSREPSGNGWDVGIGVGKGLGNLVTTDLVNLGVFVKNHANFFHGMLQKQLNEAAVAVFQNGDTLSANILADASAAITDSGYVDDLFHLDNDRQRMGAGLAGLVPVGAILKLVAGPLGKWATKVFRGGKPLETATSEAKTLVTAGDAATEAATAKHATGATGGTGGGGVHVGGSIRNVNPLRGKTNCANCAIATDATLAGRPASALAGKVTATPVLERMFGGRFVKVTGKAEIEATLLKAGNGARGIVFGSRGPRVGHYFNAVNQRGVIRFLDGQTGKVASFDGFNEFFFLPTN